MLSISEHLSVPFLLQPETPRQTDRHRSKLLATYALEELYQAKRKCNASQECDINLLEGDLVAVMEQRDPLGSTSRWLVDTGSKSCFCSAWHSTNPWGPCAPGQWLGWVP